MHSQPHTQTQKSFILLILILGCIIAIGPLSVDMYLPAFSAIAKRFNATESEVQLSLTFYFIGMSCGQLLYGPIVDRFGRRIPLFFGLSIFIISSILCCFSRDINELIILRFFQAIGVCASFVIPRAIVRDLFSTQESARVFSHLTLVIGVVPILAPIGGSLILQIFDWRGIFAFLALFGICNLLLSYFFLPQTKGANKEDKISNSVKKYFGILKDRNFVICAMSGGFAMAGLFSYLVGSPFIYLKFFGISPQNYSFVFAINSIGFIFFSQINARLLKKFLLRKILDKILFLPAIFGIIMILIGAFHPTFLSITAIFFIFLASIGMVNPNMVAASLANQSAHAGSASAMLGTIQFIIATIASLAISNLHNGTAVPITFVCGICGIASCLVYKIWFRKL
jgi:DHA1 family bicyclomycin/chloramphenicol resistance-like MFS transporter